MRSASSRSERTPSSVLQRLPQGGAFIGPVARGKRSGIRTWQGLDSLEPRILLSTSYDFGDAPAPFPTFEDGHREILLCEAILASHREERWVEVAPGG